MARSTVVFPQPDGPSKLANIPSSNSNEVSVTAALRVSVLARNVFDF